MPPARSAATTASEALDQMDGRHAPAGPPANAIPTATARASMNQPALQTIDSRPPGPNRRSSTARPASTATAAVGANSSSNTARQSAAAVASVARAPAAWTAADKVAMS